MSITPIAQENFNPTNPYGDFYNTHQFASTLEKSMSFTVGESDRAWERGQSDIRQATSDEAQN